MKVIIPAAGYATRLFPLTKDKPKAFLDVKDKPILEHIMDKIFELGSVEEIVIVTNSKFFDNFDYWREKFNSQIPIKVLDDHTESNEDRLGAIGDINYVIEEEKIDSDVLIINADNLFNFSLKPIYEVFSSTNTTLVGLYDIKSLEDAKRFGVVALDSEKKLIDFEEKPLNPKSTLISTGIYFFPKEIAKLIPKYLKEGNKPDAPGNFLVWLYKLKPVLGHTFKKEWFDIGSFEALGKAREEFKP